MAAIQASKLVLLIFTSLLIGRPAPLPSLAALTSTTMATVANGHLHQAPATTTLATTTIEIISANESTSSASSPVARSSPMGELSSAPNTDAYLLKELSGVDMVNGGQQQQHQQQQVQEPTGNLQEPANHQNYPVEPYPSASYTSLVTSSPPNATSLAAQPASGSLVAGIASATGTTSVPSLSPHQHHFNAFLNRDHHQSISSLPMQSQWHQQSAKDNESQTASGSITSSTYTTQSNSATNHNHLAPSSSLASSDSSATAVNGEHTWNHNYSPSSQVDLSTGLIQNLTSSLFPYRQLSNATLYTLSELLNKSKQQQQSTSPAGFFPSNDYKPTTYTLGNANSHHYQFAPSTSRITTSSSSYLDPSQNEQQYATVFDYIRPNQFGLRESSVRSSSTAQSGSGSSQQANISRQSTGNIQQVPPGAIGTSASSGYKQTSYNNNNYYQQQQQHQLPNDGPMRPLRFKGASSNPSLYSSSFVPYKDAASPLTAPNIASNGFNMAHLYADTYASLDGGPTAGGGSGGSSYKLPVMTLNNLKQYLGDTNKPQQVAAGSGGANGHAYAGGILQMSGPNLASANYQFVQHQQQQQSQVDNNKIVHYNSSPFRPSVVSPPLHRENENSLQQQQQQQNHKQSQNNLVAGARLPVSSIIASSNRQQQQQPQTPKVAESQAMVGANENSLSNKHSDYSTGSSNSTSSYANKDPTSYQRAMGAKSLGDTPELANQQQQPQPQVMSDEFGDFASYSNITSSMNNATGGAAPPQAEVEQQNRLAQPILQHQQQQMTQHSPPALINHHHHYQQPAFLFDLYEREVDNQIREALLGEQQGAELDAHLLAATRVHLNSLHNHQHHHHQPGVLPHWLREPERPGPFEQADASSSTGTANLMPASWPTRPQTMLSSASFGNFGSHSHATQSSGGKQRDPLNAALQELPTFAASDLQPFGPQPTPYSYLSSDPTHPAEPSLVASQLMAAQLFGQTSASEEIEQVHSGSSSSSNSGGGGQRNKPQPSSSSSGLPGILYKLNSTPLSSILTSPLAHLYASFPLTTSRHRHKNKQHQTQQPNQAQSSSSSIFPMGAKSLLSALGTSTSASVSPEHQQSAPGAQHHKYRNRNHHRQNYHQQQQQQQLALAAANLLAAASASAAVAEHPGLTPFQVAFLQAQLSQASAPALRAYLSSSSMTNSAENELSSLIGPGSDNNQQPLGNQQAATTAADSLSVGATSASGVAPHTTSPFSGITGGGISPLIWRNILSPAHWARKQSSSLPLGVASSSPQTLVANQDQPTTYLSAGSQVAHNSNPNLNSNSNQNKLNPPGNQQGSVHKPYSLLPLSTFLGATHLAQLFSSASQQQQRARQAPSQQQPRQSSHRPAGRFEIKILKIPVAFYEQPMPASGLAFLEHQHRPMEPVASSRQFQAAQVPCPLHHHHHQQAGFHSHNHHHHHLQPLESRHSTPTTATLGAQLAALASMPVAALQVPATPLASPPATPLPATLTPAATTSAGSNSTQSVAPNRQLWYPWAAN